jgi:hypothetical protein
MVARGWIRFFFQQCSVRACLESSPAALLLLLMLLPFAGRGKLLQWPLVRENLLGIMLLRVFLDEHQKMLMLLLVVAFFRVCVVDHVVD